MPWGANPSAAASNTVFFEYHSRTTSSPTTTAAADRMQLVYSRRRIEAIQAWDVCDVDKSHLCRTGTDATF